MTTIKTPTIVMIAFLALMLTPADAATLQGSYSENIFAAEGQVDARFQSTDDVFLVGGKVNYEGRTTESLYLAGGQLSVRNAEARTGTIAGGNVSIVSTAFRELIAAGGDVEIHETKLKDDLTLAAGKLTIERTIIGGSMTLHGGQVTYLDNSARNAALNGGSVTIGGKISGDVQVKADRLRILPGSVIQGDLTHSARSVEISPEAKVNGRITVLPPPAAEKGWRKGAAVFAAILFFLGTLLVPALLVTLFSRLSESAGDQIRGRFWETLGRGTLLALIVPLALVLLLGSVIGTPLGLAALPFVAAGCLLSWAIAVFVVGDQLRRWITRDAAAMPVATRKKRFGWTLLGAVVLALLLGVPVLGVVLAAIAFLMGLGGMAAALRLHFHPT